MKVSTRRSRRGITDGKESDSKNTGIGEAVKYFIGWRKMSVLPLCSLMPDAAPSFEKWARNGTLHGEDLGLLLLGSEGIARGRTPDYPFVLKASMSWTTLSLSRGSLRDAHASLASSSASMHFIVGQFLRESRS